MTKSRTQKAADFLNRILPHAPLEAMGGASVIETVMPTQPVPSEHQSAVESAAAKLVSGGEMTGPEQFALEAIIIPDKRPAIDIINGDYTVTHPLWTKFSTDAGIHARIKAALPSIGRIELPHHPSLPYGGTGFVVGQNLLMTNRHVAEIFASGLGIRMLSFRPGLSAAIDFKQEKGSDESVSVGVREVVMIHPYWDMALLHVDGLGAEQAPLVLSLTHPEDLVGRDVAVIGYPAFDPRNDAAVQNKVFAGEYYIKRLQPGKIGPRRTISSFQHDVSATTHDSSTLGGNSGSAVVDASTGHVVALHFAGVYLDANFGVPTSELARDGHVIDTGVNFDPGARAEPGIWSDAWRVADPDEAARRPEATTSTVLSNAPAADVAMHMLSVGESATWSIPIDVTIRIGAATRTSPMAASAAETTEKMVEPTHEKDYSTREGYREDFLGASVPPPEATDLDLVARTKDGEHVIPYHHFSIVMNKRRRLALFTASNVDYAKNSKQPDPSKTYTRKSLGGLGDKDMELWFTDPRIAANEQLPDRFFTKDKGAFDKGHIVRREDVAWGASFEEVQLANGDTFHTTNCSPQIAQFNRAKSTDNWGDLEKVVGDQAKTEKLSIFAGPVLADDDQTFVGVDEKGAVRVQIPSRYWKVIVAHDGGALQSFGFLLEQDLSDVPLEFVVDETWTRHMISIAELEQRLRVVRFPSEVRGADQAGTQQGEAIREAAQIKMTS